VRDRIGVDIIRKHVRGISNHGSAISIARASLQASFRSCHDGVFNTVQPSNLTVMKYLLRFVLLCPSWHICYIPENPINDFSLQIHYFYRSNSYLL